MAQEGVHHVETGISAEGWLKMWEDEYTHDHGQHVDGSCGEECSHGHGDIGEGHDETHFTSCDDTGDHDAGHGCHSDQHGQCGHGKVDMHLKRNLHHLTGGDEHKAILVSLCGNSPDMEWLCGLGYRVVGTELSETAVKRAFEQAVCGPIPFEVSVDGNIKVYSATDGKKLKIFVGNFLDQDGITPAKLGTFDCIWDSHGIVALPEDQQKLYAEKLSTFLKPGDGGKILFSTVDYDIAMLKSGPAPAPIPASVLQRFYSGCEVELLENEPLRPGKLEGVGEWTNPVVLVTFK